MSETWLFLLKPHLQHKRRLTLSEQGLSPFWETQRCIKEARKDRWIVFFLLKSVLVKIYFCKVDGINCDSRKIYLITEIFTKPGEQRKAIWCKQQTLASERLSSTPVLLLACSVVFEKLLNLSEPLCPHLHYRSVILKIKWNHAYKTFTADPGPDDDGCHYDFCPHNL